MSQFSPMGSSSSMRPHRGVMILVFGILGLVLCVVFGVVAWIMGNGDIREMDAGSMDPSGRGLTQAGRICGMISVILMIIGIIVAIAVLVLGIGAAAAGAAAGAGGP